MDWSTIEILLVEDNPQDVHHILNSLQEVKLHNIVHVVENGAEALAFLRAEGPYGAAPYPDMIVFDLDVSCKHGFSTFCEVTSDPRFSNIPVVALVADETSRELMEKQHITSALFLAKPLSILHFMSAVVHIGQFSLGIVGTA
ncbi:MAG: response regulator [Anaerolineae bacterium]